MNTDEWVYLGYNNRDVEIALEIAQQLLADGFMLWLDRFSIAPDAAWEVSLNTIQQQSKKALVLLSSNSLNSVYCRQELQQLQSNQALIIALCLDNETLETIDKNAFAEIIDCRPSRNRTEIVQEIKLTLKRSGCFTAPISEERQYLFALIKQTELALMNSTSARLAILNNDGSDWEKRKLRPRCHTPLAWLSHAQFDLYEAAMSPHLEQTNHLVLSNMLEWSDWRSRMMIVGKAGTGKSTLLQYLCLLSAFRCLERGQNQALPFYLELSAWQGKQRLQQFIQENWPLNSDVEELLRRGAVVLFVDGLGEDIVMEKRHHLELETILDTELFPAVISCAREESLVLDLPSDLAFVQINQLQEEQSRLIAETVFPNKQLDGLPQQLEALLARLFTESYAPGNCHLNWRQQYQYCIPSLWQQIYMPKNSRFTIADLENGLETLACTFIDTEAVTYCSYQSALNALGNDLLLQLAINLGLLKVSGQRFRFVSNALPLYLAAQKLLKDGVYQYLSHPRFDEKGQHLPYAWDKVIIFAADLISVDDLALYIQAIADVDPYLAYMLAQVQNPMPVATMRYIVGKLLEPRRTALRSIPLSSSILNSFADKALVSQMLLEAMREQDKLRARLAFQFLLALNLPIESELMQAVEQLEPEFPDSVYSALETFADSKSLLQLCRLATLGESNQRQRVIYALSEVAPRLATVVISQLSMDDTSSLLVMAAKAMGKLKDAEMLAFLYQLLLHSDKTVVEAAEDAILQMDKGIKAALLIFLSHEDTLNQTLLEKIANSSEKTLSILLDYTLGNLGYGLSHSIDLKRISDGSSEMVKQLLDLLSSKMASLSSREAFQEFANEMLNHQEIQRPKAEPEDKPRSAMARRVRRAEPGHNNVVPKSEQVLPESLLRAMKDSDWLIRLNALEQIAQYPAELSLPLVLAACEDKDAQVRMAALKALPASREYPEVLEAYLKALEDADNQVIDATAECLRQNSEAALEQLLKKLQSSNTYTLATVIELLGQKGDETVVAPLASFIDDVREPWMWNHCIGDIAVQALLTIGSPEALQIVQDSGRIAYPTFSDIILPGSDDSPTMDTSPFDIFQGFLNDLHSDSWQVSQQAARQIRTTAQGMKGQDNEALARFLSEYLQDSNWVVRWTIVETLAWLGSHSVLPDIVHLLQDENWMVQIASIRSLIELKSSEGLSEIEKLLFHSNTTVREAAAEALGALGNTHSLQVLSQAMQDKDQFVRLAVVRAIIAVCDETQIDLLLDALSDNYSHVRWYAIRAVAQVANPQHIRSIVPLLRDNSKPAWEKYSISNYAELALHRMGSPSSKKVLAKWAEVKQLQK